MELRLAIQLGLIFFVLAWNTVLLWALYRVLRGTERRLDRWQGEDAEVMRALGTSVRSAERASSRVAVLSGEVRSGVAEMSEVLDRADNWARYGLAKLDFNADRAAEKLGRRTRRFSGRLGGPICRTAAAVQGIRALLDLVARSQDGRSRRRRRLRVPEPLDTAATLLQAVTAFGALFSPRNRGDGGKDDSTR